MKRSRGPKYLALGVLGIFSAGVANEKLQKYKEDQPPPKPFHEIVSDFQEEAMAAHPGVSRQEALRLHHIDRMNQRSDKSARRVSAAALARSAYIASQAEIWACEQEGAKMFRYAPALERELGGPVQAAVREFESDEMLAYSDGQLTLIRIETQSQMRQIAQGADATILQLCKQMDAQADEIFPGELPKEVRRATEILLGTE